jgi:hypothetical protein
MILNRVTRGRKHCTGRGLFYGDGGPFRVRLAVLLLSALSLSGSALALPDWLVVWDAAEQGWASFALTNIEPGFNIGVYAREGAAASFGLHIYDATGATIASQFGLLGAAGHQVTVGDDATGLDFHSEAPPSPSESMFGVSFTFSEHREKAYVVGWAAGANVSWTILGLPKEDAQVRNLLHGTSAYYNDGAEWWGTNARANTPLLRAAASVSNHTLQVAGTFVGHLAANGQNAALATVTSEAGTQTCPCEFVALDDSEEEALVPVGTTRALAAGEYELSWTGASARLAGGLFAGADVRIAELTE